MRIPSLGRIRSDNAVSGLDGSENTVSGPDGSENTVSGLDESGKTALGWMVGRIPSLGQMGV